MNFHDLISKFKRKWKTDNARRSEDYLMGGAVMATELTAHLAELQRKQPDAGVLRDKLAKAEKELQEAQQRNQLLRQQQTTIIHQTEAVQQQLAQAVPKMMMGGGANKAQGDEITRLRKKVVEQETQLRARGLHIQTLMKELANSKAATR